MYEHYYGGGVTPETLDQLFAVVEQIPQSGPLGQHLPTFHTLVSEALNWCQRHDDAYQILQLASQRYATDETFVGWAFHQQLLLNLALAELKRGDINSAESTFEKIKPYLFDVHSRQFNLLNYHLLESLLHRSKGEDEEVRRAIKKATKIAEALKYDGLLKNIFPTLRS